MYYSITFPLKEYVIYKHIMGKELLFFRDTEVIYFNILERKFYDVRTEIIIIFHDVFGKVSSLIENSYLLKHKKKFL